MRVVRDAGNLFLTNIHRVYLGDVREPTLEDDDLRDYFLQPFGARPSGKTTDSKTDLGSRVDRHENLGVGKIGESAIKKIVNHPRLTHIPFVLETPDLKGLETAHGEVQKLRQYIEGGAK